MLSGEGENIMSYAVKFLLAVSGVLIGGLVIGGVTATSAAEAFTLTSSTFKDGTLMPRRVGGNMASNPNCAGDGVSPALSWANPPPGTKSYAITMVDPEARNGLGVVQWIAYGIPASVTSLAEGEFSKPSNEFVAGKGTRGSSGYDGPCTPPPATHHYTFVIIATNLAPDALPPGLTRDQLLAKLPGHALLASGLVGLFTKPKS
jgi:Raf kinase inhibitor-like YbhB/YbcL family protein